VISDEGQEAIGAFEINGQQAFFPNAGQGPS
jgi:ABC-type tungstate transport system permease subunit